MIHFLKSSKLLFYFFYFFTTVKQREIEEQEESTLYSQAIHFANRMVYLRVPVDINATYHRRMYNDRDNTSNSIANR